jgi:hypothetical protein
MHAIEAHGLSKTYPGGVQSVKGIDFEVSEGDVFGLLGPNGAGDLDPFVHSFGGELTRRAEVTEPQPAFFQALARPGVIIRGPTSSRREGSCRQPRLRRSRQRWISG